MCWCLVCTRFTFFHSNFPFNTSFHHCKIAYHNLKYGSYIHNCTSYTLYEYILNLAAICGCVSVLFYNIEKTDIEKLALDFNSTHPFQSFTLHSEQWLNERIKFKLKKKGEEHSLSRISLLFSSTFSFLFYIVLLKQFSFACHINFLEWI